MVTTLRQPRVAALAVLALGVWALHAGRPPSAVAQPPTRLPSRLGLWSGRPLPVEPRVLQVLETNDVTLMEYHLLGKEPPVWFVQVAGVGNRAAFHPPELCFVGSHFEVLERGPVSAIVNGEERTLMRLVIGQGKERYEAWYWFTANGRVTPSYYEQQLWLVMESIRRKPSSGTLVRISTVLEDPAASHRRLLDFVTALETVRPLSNLRVARHGL